MSKAFSRLCSCESVKAVLALRGFLGRLVFVAVAVAAAAAAAFDVKEDAECR